MDAALEQLVWQRGRKGVFMSDVSSNQQVAAQICSAGRLNGKQFLPGECVALLDGNVVAVAKDLETALRSLRALDPDPERGMVFEVGPPVTDVIRRMATWPLLILPAFLKPTPSRLNSSSRAAER